MNSPLVSIIVLNWNGREILEECLKALSATRYANIEIIVVDNGSTDNSIALVKSLSAVKLIEIGKNIGYAAGNNRGIAAAKGKYVVTLNNDMSVEPTWLDDPVARMESLPDVGAVSCRQMNYYNRSTIDGLYHFFTSWLGSSPMGASLPMTNASLYCSTGYVFGANGGSAIYRKEMLDAIGLFDERYFAYNEETDLCFRGLLHGWKCLYVPNAVVYHKGGVSFAKLPAKYFYLRERNRIWFTFKFFPLSWILLHLPFLLYYELRILRVIALKHRLPQVYIWSRIDALLGLGQFRGERRSNRALFRKHSAYIKELVKTTMIVIKPS